MTPPRLIELACPACDGHYWVIDSDYRGGDMFGGKELSYPERSYTCRHCGETHTNQTILQKGPPEFFLQPHDLYPMSVADFNHWYAIFAAHFPDDERQERLGIAWYPGPRRDDDWEMTEEELGTFSGYRFRLLQFTLEDLRPQVHVSSPEGEVRFRLEPTIKVIRLVYGYKRPELQRIAALIAEHKDEIRAAWEPYIRRLKQFRAENLARLQMPEEEARR